MDSFDDELSGMQRFWANLHPSLRAAAMFAIPFIIVDFFNYYSAGTAMALSLPVLALLYAGCGAAAARFTRLRGRSEYAFNGALAGFALWGASLLVNGVIALFAGLGTFGTTLLLGVPYILCCGPLQIIGGGIMGAAGGGIYGMIVTSPPPPEL